MCEIRGRNVVSLLRELSIYSQLVSEFWLLCGISSESSFLCCYGATTGDAFHGPNSMVPSRAMAPLSTVFRTALPCFSQQAYFPQPAQSSPPLLAGGSKCSEYLVKAQITPG